MLRAGRQAPTGRVGAEAQTTLAQRGELVLLQVTQGRKIHRPRRPRRLADHGDLSPQDTDDVDLLRGATPCTPQLMARLPPPPADTRRLVPQGAPDEGATLRLEGRGHVVCQRRRHLGSVQGSGVQTRSTSADEPSAAGSPTKVGRGRPRHAQVLVGLRRDDLADLLDEPAPTLVQHRPCRVEDAPVLVQ